MFQSHEIEVSNTSLFNWQKVTRELKNKMVFKLLRFQLPLLHKIALQFDECSGFRNCKKT